MKIPNYFLIILFFLGEDFAPVCLRCALTLAPPAGYNLKDSGCAGNCRRVRVLKVKRF